MLKHLLLGVTCLSLGCMPEFDEAWVVKDLRILGIRAHPPEVRLPGASTPLPTITVDALVVNPAAPSNQPYAWELWACTGETALCDGAMMRALLRSDRTALDAIRHEFVPSGALLRKALELFPSWRLRRAWVPLTLELRVFQDEGPVVRGVKQLHIKNPDLSGAEPNSNPWLERIELDGEPIADPIRIEQCRRVELEVQVYDYHDNTVLSVYASQGSFTSRESVHPGTALPGFTVSWSPCGGEPTRKVSHLWLVLRDGDGGIDWREVRASLGP